MKAKCQEWTLIVLSMVSFLILPGCISDSLNQYAEYDYGEDRANLLCHPFWNCQEGEWMRVGKSRIDSIVDFAKCEQRLDIYGGWLQDTVTLGMEAGRCMVLKDYTLRYPNPLRP